MKETFFLEIIFSNFNMMLRIDTQETAFHFNRKSVKYFLKYCIFYILWSAEYLRTLPVILSRFSNIVFLIIWQMIQNQINGFNLKHFKFFLTYKIYNNIIYLKNKRYLLLLPLKEYYYLNKRNCRPMDGFFYSLQYL